MPEKPAERDPEGSTQLIITLALEVLHLVSVISVALGFSSVKAGFYCLHHKILKWLFFFNDKSTNTKCYYFNVKIVAYMVQ